MKSILFPPLNVSSLTGTAQAHTNNIRVYTQSASTTQDASLQVNGQTQNCLDFSSTTYNYRWNESKHWSHGHVGVGKVEPLFPNSFNSLSFLDVLRPVTEDKLAREVETAQKILPSQSCKLAQEGFVAYIKHQLKWIIPR